MLEYYVPCKTHTRITSLLVCQSLNYQHSNLQATKYLAYSYRYATWTTLDKHKADKNEWFIENNLIFIHNDKSD